MPDPSTSQDLIQRRVGAAIRRQRQRRSWTQERLAEAAGLTAPAGSVDRRTALQPAL